MIATVPTDLHPWRCANPECPSRRTGRGQIVMWGEVTPGWRGGGYCHQCRRFTTVQIDQDGQVTLRVEAHARNTSFER